MVDSGGFKGPVPGAEDVSPAPVAANRGAEPASLPAPEGEPKRCPGMTCNRWMLSASRLAIG